MITYEQAKKTAVNEKPEVNTVLEYKDAYMFYNSKARGNNLEDNEVIVLKKNGKVINMTEYIMGTKDNTTPKRIKF